jgi:hypothetical protein
LPTTVKRAPHPETMKMGGERPGFDSPPAGDGPVVATTPRVPCTFGAAETRGYSSFSPAGNGKTTFLGGRRGTADESSRQLFMGVLAHPEGKENGDRATAAGQSPTTRTGEGRAARSCQSSLHRHKAGGSVRPSVRVRVGPCQLGPRLFSG